MRLREHEGIKEGKLDMLRADPRHLVVQQNYNVRDLDTPEAQEKLRELSASIAEVGVKDPLLVRFDGENIIVVEGHRRLAATMMAIEAGVDIKSIPVYPEPQRINDAERDLGLIISNSGEPLTALEKAKVVGRLVAHGWSQQEIAKKCGWKSVASVVQYLEMLAMPEAVKEQVRQGDVSATTARQIVKETARDAKNDPDFAAELIRKNMEENARIRGKDKRHKVTTKTLKRDKPKPEPKAKTDLAPRPVTSFFQGLTPAQQEQALAYDGPENLGPESESAPRTMADFGEGKPPPPRVEPSGQEYPGFVTIQPNQPTGRALKDILAALKPFADLCAEFDANEKLDDDIVEVFFSDIKRAWKAYTAATGGSEAEAA
jgi:ParB/RepB/Spo0J family partition protein